MENHDLRKLIPKVDWKKLVQRINSSGKIKYILHRLHPGCIIRNRSTGKEWNQQLLRILDTPISISRRSEHVVIINGESIWVANYPYAYGSSEKRGVKGLPSRSTVVKLKMVVDALDEKLSKERYK